MFEKILNTFSARMASAVLSLLIVVLTSQFLGAEGRGEISLFITNISIILLVSELVGGTALIYLTPRTNVFHLLIPSYIWALVACSVTSAVIYYLGQVPAEYAKHLLLLSLLHAGFAIQSNFLLGKEKVKQYNFISFLQIALLSCMLVIVFYIFDIRKVTIYFYSLYISYGISFLLSGYFLSKSLLNFDFTGFKDSLKSLLKYGTTAQTSNIITFINYRLSYYFLYHFLDSKTLGVYSVGVSLSEAVWMVGRSIGLVQYTRLVNTEDKGYAVRVSVKFAKLSFLVTFAAISIMAIVPNKIYKLVFGQEFGDVNLVILTLALGIVAVGLSIIFSHYFAGLGKYKVNNWASFCGLIITVPTCYFLIPKYGLIGAGISATLSYLGTAIFLLYNFISRTDTTFSALIPRKYDVLEAKEALLEFLNKSKFQKS